MTRTSLHWCLGLAAAMALAGAAAQEPPLLVLSPKAASAGCTGVHRPHTKLHDVLERHKGQPDWSEACVEDEGLSAKWQSTAAGQKAALRMNGEPGGWSIV